jgi:hypothetical protein
MTEEFSRLHAVQNIRHDAQCFLRALAVGESLPLSGGEFFNAELRGQRPFPF